MRGRLNHFHPQAPDQLGEFQALDLRTGETLWRQRLRVPYNTSALTTGGGLVFIGDWGRRVHAYDARTGEPLWRSRLPTMANGFPITYAVDGRQFVAFVAGPSIGGSSWATILPADLLPEERNPRGGSGVFVFRVALTLVLIHDGPHRSKHAEAGARQPPDGEAGRRPVRACVDRADVRGRVRQGGARGGCPRRARWRGALPASRPGARSRRLGS